MKHMGRWSLLLLGLGGTGCGEYRTELAEEVSAINASGPMTALPTGDFELEDTNEWALQYLRLAVLAQKSTRRTVDQVIADSNHDGTQISSLNNVGCFHTGFTFDSDHDVCWRPQGISGSADAYPEASGLTPAGRKALVVSWHDDECSWSDGQARGSRVTFVDVTSMSAIRYRRVLLVEPCESAAGTTTVCKVNVHAGGISWVGNYLYVVDTNRGLRVFDVSYLLEVNTTDAAAATTLGVSGNKIYAFDYKYILPQVGRYENISAADPNFSWMSLDRSTSPPSLITGEYDGDSYDGRVMRWDLAANDRVATSGGVAEAREARTMTVKRVQGGFSRRIGGVTKYWFVGSPSSDSDRLYRKTASGLEEYFTFASQGTPQNLHYSPFSDNLWSLDEFNGRPVFACKLASVD